MRKLAWLWYGLVVVFLCNPLWAQDLIVNGAFSSTVTAWHEVNAFGTPIASPVNWEPGFEGWTTAASPSNYMPITTTGAFYSPGAVGNGVTITAYHDSAPGAFVGNNDLETGGVNASITQTIAMPDALGATLTFWYQWKAPHFDFPHPEYARINFGSYVLVTKSSLDYPSIDWEKITFYMPMNGQTGVVLNNGQTLDLIFRTTDDNSQDDNFLLVDDVSLIVNDIATATPTPTVTPTYTHTPTVTKTPTITPSSTISPTNTRTPTITKTLTLTPWFIQQSNVLAYPNPVNGNEVYFIYTLPNPVDLVTIDVYNLSGQKVATLQDHGKEAGVNRKTSWSISGVAPGIYLYRLTLEAANGYKDQTKFKKLVITK